MSTLAVWPTQPPAEWLPGALSWMVKWLECEADCSPPSGDEIKNEWCHTSTDVCLHGVQMESFSFYYINCMLQLKARL
jgi:hypothetical protein